MTPGDPAVLAVNRALEDPNFRASVRQMHAENYPLLKMVEALGLEDDISPEIRQILADLPPDVVAGIRHATLAMLDRDGRTMPLSCNLSGPELQIGTPIDVDVASIDGEPTIRVRARENA
jgi:hypothetical protein